VVQLDVHWVMHAVPSQILPCAPQSIAELQTRQPLSIAHVSSEAPPVQRFIPICVQAVRPCGGQVPKHALVADEHVGVLLAHAEVVHSVQPLSPRTQDSNDPGELSLHRRSPSVGHASVHAAVSAEGCDSSRGFSAVAPVADVSSSPCSPSVPSSSFFDSLFFLGFSSRFESDFFSGGGATHAAASAATDINEIPTTRAKTFLFPMNTENGKLPASCTAGNRGQTTSKARSRLRTLVEKDPRAPGATRLP
jgi:hypothetical protein